MVITASQTKGDYKMDKYKVKERKEFRQIFGFDAPICQSSVTTGKFNINLLKLDTMIPGFNGEECTYNGKPEYSLFMAIREKYGDRAVKLVAFLI